jgi:hypothetical protein|tara:strand:+ start:1074 stop:1343 length:270 start_codon:yes stop_codon:yes gene_type:complete
MKKRLMKVGFALWILSAPAAFGLAVFNNLAIRRAVAEQDENVDDLYLLLLIQARQIRTLNNLELRRLNPDIQRRLKLERDKYTRLNNDD